MLPLSILICGEGSAAELSGQLTALHGALQEDSRSYEVVVAGPKPLQLFQERPASETAAPSPRFVTPRNAPRSLAAQVRLGLATSQGECVILLEFGNRNLCRSVPALLSRLARADFVQGKRQRSGINKLSHRLARIPQWAVLGLDVRDAGCLFWGARREALCEISLNEGVLRYLGPLVAQNGFRVDEITVPYSQAEEQPRVPGSLLSAWREKQRIKNERDLQDTAPDASESVVFPAETPATIPLPTQRRKSA